PARQGDAIAGKVSSDRRPRGALATVALPRFEQEPGRETLEIAHADGHRLDLRTETEGHLGMAWLAEIEDVDAGIVGHAAAVLRQVSLAVVVHVVANGDAIGPGLGRGHAY